MLLSINVTGYYNHSLSEIIVVILVNEDNISKRDYIRYSGIKTSDRYKRTVSRRERGKVVYSLVRSKPIALFKYNCCIGVNSTNNKHLYRGEDDIKCNQTVISKPTFENIL